MRHRAFIGMDCFLDFGKESYELLAVTLFIPVVMIQWIEVFDGT